MTSPSEQAAMVAGTLRAKPALLCRLLQDLRGEKLAGSWEGEETHQARLSPWTGTPLCAVWKDHRLPEKQWRWSLRKGESESGSAETRERAKAQATIILKKRGYIFTDWTEDND